MQFWLRGLVKRRSVRLYQTLEHTKKRNKLGRNSLEKRKDLQSFLKTATKAELEQFSDTNRKSANQQVSQAIYKIRKADDFENALKAFKKAQEDALVDLSLYSTFLQSCVRFKEVSYGEAVFERILRQDLEPNDIVYHQMMNLYGKNGAVDAAIQVYNDMVKDDVLPNELIMNTMISICGKHGYFDKAKEFYDEMIRIDLEPTETTFSALLTGCSNERRYDDAKEVVSEMERWECPLNELHFGQLMKTASKIPDQVVHLMTKMMQSGVAPRSTTFNELLETLLSVRDFDHMDVYYELMLEIGITPNPKTCRMMLKAYSEQGRSDDILRVRKMMVDKGVPMDHTVRPTFQKAMERRRR